MKRNAIEAVMPTTANGTSRALRANGRVRWRIRAAAKGMIIRRANSATMMRVFFQMGRSSSGLKRGFAGAADAIADMI
jgi:hypothetical protein